MFKTRKESAEFIRKTLRQGGRAGLELSPNIGPIIKPEDGFEVEYLDVRSTEELRAQAAAKGRDPESAPVITHTLDFHRPISECVGGKKFDFVVSSHVIEHIPDLIGHFGQIRDVLRSGGAYAFLAPDRDLCFDCQKPKTSLGQLVEAFVEKRTVAPISAMIDEFQYGVQRGGKGGWSVHDTSPLRPKYGHPNNLIKGVISNPEQVKNWHGHIWRFTPSSFKSLYLELSLLGLIHLKIENVVPTERMEFLVVLRAP